MPPRFGALALVAAIGVTGCPEPSAPPPGPAAWVYPPDLPPWPPAPAASVVGEIGRGVLRPVPAPAGVAAGHRVWATEPLDVEALWPVPGDGPARAIASGFAGDAWAVEFVDVDAGLVRWRDLGRCQTPVAHVSADAVVCADAQHAVGLDLDDGHERWRSDAFITAGNGGLVVGLDAGAIVVLDAASGRELARGLAALDKVEAPRAVCRDGDGFDVLTAGTGAPVRRFALPAAGAGGGARVVWSLATAPPIAFDVSGARGDACDDTIVLAAAGALAPGPLAAAGVVGEGSESLVAIDRASGAVRGGPVAAIAHWSSRAGDGGVEAATARGIERRTRTLGEPVLISDAQVAGLVASRGTRRLVRQRGGGLVLIDGGAGAGGAVVEARVELVAPYRVGRAVLGDHFVLSGPWHGVRTDHDPLRRYPLPSPRGTPVAPIDPSPVDDPARYDHPDLPAPAHVDPSVAVVRDGAAAYEVVSIVIDPADPSVLYAVTLEQRPSQTEGAGVAAFDLRARRWLWYRADACPPGAPSAVAVAPAADAIACSARAVAGRSAVRATSRRDGHALWDAPVPVDALTGGAGAFAIVAASQVTLVDGATGHELDRFAADDGWMPRLAITGGGVLVDVERGAIVAREIRGAMLPRWSVRVRGAVTALTLAGTPAGERVAVSLDDGELVFLDPATGDARAAGAWSEAWQVPGTSDLALFTTRDPVLRELRLAGYGADGALRFRKALTTTPGWQLGARGRAADAPLVIASGPGLFTAAVVEPHRGALRGLFALPEHAVAGLVFGTVVDGKPVAGAVLSHPLAVVTF